MNMWNLTANTRLAKTRFASMCPASTLGLIASMALTANLYAQVPGAPPPPPGFQEVGVTDPPEPPTWGRGAGLTGRGVASGISGAVLAPAEVNALGQPLAESTVKAITGKDVKLPSYSQMMGAGAYSTPVIGPTLLLGDLLQKYTGTASPTTALNQAMTQAGVPEPQTGGERMYVNTMAGLTGGGLGGGIGFGRTALGALSGATGAAASQRTAMTTRRRTVFRAR